MTKLGDALKRKFKTPEAAIKALGLDESVLRAVMAGDKALAFDTIHPDFSKVKHLAAVQAAVRKYKEAYAQRTSSNGMGVKAAEEEINRQVEKALSPKGAHDSSRKELTTMSNKKMTLTSKAAMVMGGVVSFMKPKMAKDSKINWNWGKLLGSVTNKNFASKKGAIVAGIKEQSRGKLAKDASIDGLVELLDGFEKVEGEDDLETAGNSGLPLRDKMDEDEDLEEESMDEDPSEKLKSFLGGKGMSEDDISAACDAAGFGEAEDEENEPEGVPGAKLGGKKVSEEGEDEIDDKDAGKFASAKDEPPPFKGKPEVGGGMSKDAVNKAIAKVQADNKKAMDAALKLAKDEAKATRYAERFVRPWVGDLAMAHDSAEEVYRTALSALGKDVKGVHPSAYKVILEGIPQPGKRQVQDEALAMDTASTDSFATRYPGAMKIGRA